MEQILRDELRKLNTINNRRYKLKTEDLEILTLFFDSYYGGKSVERKEVDILNSSIDDILKVDSEFTNNIIEGIKSYPNDKCKLSERLEKLLVYLKDNYDLQFSEDTFENFKIKDKNERLLRMLKYLHSGERSRSDIAEDFGISERTVAEDLATLQDGFAFLGTEMKISKLERGSNKYKSIIHPIFLAMNSSEIFSLTVGLKLLSKGTVFEESLGRVANAVYEQLSETTKNMIDKHKDNIVSFETDSMQFLDSKRLGELLSRPFVYFLKEPILCKVFYAKNGENYEVKGILKLAEPSSGNVYDKLILETGEGIIILEKDEVQSIERSDKNKYFKDWQ